MNSNIFNIDFSKLVAWLLPNNQRKPIAHKWLMCLLFPLVVLYQSFTRYRTAKIYQLTITPQICYLERLLNDRFDTADRRIVIDDAIDHEPLYIFIEPELKPVYLFTEAETLPVWIYTEGEAGMIQDDFYVLVPIDIIFDENEMLSLLKEFKLAGTKPKIQRI